MSPSETNNVCAKTSGRFSEAHWRREGRFYCMDIHIVLLYNIHSVHHFFAQTYVTFFFLVRGVCGT